jgi:anthranilate phosphoribosyltransferase
VNTFYIHPADFGIAKASPSSLVGGGAAANADIVRTILAGERGAARDIVLLNAGAALFIAGRAETVRAGIAHAAAALDAGAARATLEAMARASHEERVG